MAALSHNLTPKELLAALESGTDFRVYKPFDWFERRYQTVRYRGALNRVDYERRDTFYAMGPKSPSDSVWMVPCGIGALVDDWHRVP